jgi:predicted nucleic acid-binding protein
MEPASLGVILDSSVVIEAERRHLNVAQFLRQVALRVGEMEAALCAITVAELAHGIHRADTPERRVRRRIFLDDLKAAVPVYPITDGTAELVGKIGAESSAAGDYSF